MIDSGGTMITRHLVVIIRLLRGFLFGGVVPHYTYHTGSKKRSAVTSTSSTHPFVRLSTTHKMSELYLTAASFLSCQYYKYKEVRA